MHDYQLYNFYLEQGPVDELKTTIISEHISTVLNINHASQVRSHQNRKSIPNQNTPKK